MKYIETKCPGCREIMVIKHKALLDHHLEYNMDNKTTLAIYCQHCQKNYKYTIMVDFKIVGVY